MANCACTTEPGDSDCAAHPRCPNCREDIGETRLAQERDRLRARLARVSEITAALADSVNSAVRDLQSRGKGGQHVSFHGEFASAQPSTLSRLGWYARELRLATSDSVVSLAAKETP